MSHFVLFPLLRKVGRFGCAGGEGEVFLGGLFVGGFELGLGKGSDEGGFDEGDD